jgi:hypothetical protein
MSLDPTQQPGPEQPQPPTERAAPEQPGPYYEYTPNSPYSPYGNTYMPSGVPQNVYSAPQAPYYGTPLQPLPLVDAIAQLPLQYWKILSRPGARSFAEESGKAKWNILLVQLIGYTVLDALLGWLHNTLYPITAQAVPTTNTNGVDVARILSAEMSIITFATGLGLFLLVPLGFFMYQGIAFGLARAFKGQGSFLTQSYTILLIYVPIGVLDIALAYVPLGALSGLVSLALDGYGIVLTVFAMMGAHRLTGGKASAVALLPLLGVFVLACCAIFAALIPAINSAVPQ